MADDLFRRRRQRRIGGLPGRRRGRLSLPSVTQMLPSRSTWMPCGNTIMPAPKLLTSLPAESNFRTDRGRHLRPWRRSQQLFAVPQRSATQTDLPSLSISTALVEPQSGPRAASPSPQSCCRDSARRWSPSPTSTPQSAPAPRAPARTSRRSTFQMPPRLQRPVPTRIARPIECLPRDGDITPGTGAGNREPEIPKTRC